MNVFRNILKNFNYIYLLESREIRIRAIFSQYTLIFWVIFMVMVIQTVLQLSVPIILKFLIDNIITNKDINGLFITIFILVTAILLSKVVALCANWLITSTNENITLLLRRDFFQSISRYSLAFYSTKNAGDVSSRICGDISALQAFYPIIFFDLLITFLLIFITCVVLFFIDWKLSLLIFMIIPFFLINLIIFGKRLKKASYNIRQAESRLFSFLTEKINGILIIKLFVQEANCLKQFFSFSLDLKDNIIKTNIMNSMSSILSSLTLILGTTLILGYGGHEVIQGKMTLGSLVAFIAFLDFLKNPIEKIGSIYRRMQSSKASVDRIKEYSQFDEQSNPRDGKILQACRGKLKFENVSFRYNDKKIIENLSFELNPNEVMNIIGRSGIGKTTIAYLICGLLKCQQGKIYIDDYDVNDLDAKILQRYIGFVTQKAILFNTTIAENIKLGREEISEDQVIAAAKIAQIHDFIDELPLKYKTEIGTDAMKISGGQQQRITWARAIAAKPSILILDEATSNVDRDTAVRMFRELEPVMKDKTTIFISHQYYPELPIHTKIDLNEIN